jgi:hypothetical protein
MIENSLSVGLTIFSTPVFKSSKPITITITATVSAERYSYRPWPYGCSLSGGFSESLKPKRLTTLEDASNRLLKASAIIATATPPPTIPATNFAANSIIFATIPTIPESLPYAALTLGFAVSS